MVSNSVVLILRIAFMFYFARALYLTRFKKKRDKYIWFAIVFVFSHYGYAIYLAFRRRLVVKRKFAPKFNPR